MPVGPSLERSAPWQRVIARRAGWAGTPDGMQRTRVSIVVAVLLICWSLSPSLPHALEPTSGENEVLTLETALNLGLEHNLHVENARLEVSKSEKRVAVARTHYFPSLKFSLMPNANLTDESYTFEKGAFGNFPATGPIPAKTTEIETTRGISAIVTTRLSQPLSQLYRLGLEVEKQEVNQKLAEEDLRAEQQRVADEIKQVYYDILEKQSSLEATDESIVFLTELDILTDRYVAQRVTLEYQSLQVKTRLARARHTALVDRNTIASKKERMNDLLGRDLDTSFLVSPVPDASAFTVDVSAMREQAVADRPKIRAARLEVERARYDIQIKKSEYIPDLSFVVSYTSPLNTELLPQNIARVSLLATWEFYDWGRKQKELAERAAELAQARNNVRSAAANVQLEVDENIRKLNEAKALLPVARLAQKAAREELRVKMNAYRKQATLLQEVLEVESRLAKANSDYQEAQLSVWKAWASLEKAVGEL